MKCYNRTRCDVAVIGGGPAGCATAIYLARAGYSVIVFDGFQKPNPSRTEVLTASAGHELEKLGISRCGLSEVFQPALGVVSIWGSRKSQIADSFRQIQGEGAHVHREGFDRHLTESARTSGAIVLTGCRFASLPGRQNGCWSFQFACKAGKAACSCRFLVDATGRSGSPWLRPLAPRIPLDRLMAVLWTGESQSNSQYLIIESIEDGWFYAAGSSRTRTTIALVTDCDCLKDRVGPVSDYWLSRLSCAPSVEERLPRNPDLQTLSIISAATVVRTRSAGPGWCAVGDATFSHDPLSGLGVTHALESAAYAGSSIERYLRAGTSLHEYETWIASRLKAYLLQKRDTYSLERRWLNSGFWQRRLNPCTAKDARPR